MIQGTYSLTPLPDHLANQQGKREVSEKRRNGVFYTPERATQILTSWAIQNPTERVLEPSFGGCGFLVASRNRLIELGNIYPECALYGCDIDPDAFKSLRELFDKPDECFHFKKTDFLTVTPTDFPTVSAIVGNPPYVSLHNMAVEQRTVARAIAESAEVAINGRASLWTYFVLHSLSFLEVGGRMAWILPGSFVYSEYAEPLRKKLAATFGRCLAVLLEDRIFVEEGTEESSVVLLCENYQNLPIEQIKLVSAKGLSELDNIIKAWTTGEVVGETWQKRPQLALLSQSLRESYLSILESQSCFRFGDFADVKIGIVTGANKFFVLNEKQVQKASLPEIALEPILSSFSHCQGLELTTQDVDSIRSQDLRCLLLNTIHLTNIPEEVSVYLSSFPLEKKDANVTFKSRAIWHQVHDRIYPDAFFSSMQSGGPILMLNTAHVACTNTVYQVKFRHNLFTNFAPDPKMLAISIQSTFSQFSAEVEGRSFGHGALKVEPSEVKNIAVLLSNDRTGLDAIFARVDECFRNGNRLAASMIADNWLIERGLIQDQDILKFQAGIEKLRTMRSGYRKEVTA